MKMTLAQKKINENHCRNISLCPTQTETTAINCTNFAHAHTRRKIKKNLFEFAASHKTGHIDK
jgi:hypothetical protein